MVLTQNAQVSLNALELYPINGHPGHILVWRIQAFSLHSIQMHQLVPLAPIHTLHDAGPAQFRVVEFHTLHTTEEKRTLI